MHGYLYTVSIRDTRETGVILMAFFAMITDVFGFFVAPMGWMSFVLFTLTVFLYFKQKNFQAWYAMDQDSIVRYALHPDERSVLYYEDVKSITEVTVSFHEWRTERKEIYLAVSRSDSCLWGDFDIKDIAAYDPVLIPYSNDAYEQLRKYCSHAKVGHVSATVADERSKTYDDLY